MVHIVNFSPVRRTPKHTDFHDDPIPLFDVTVRVNLPLKISTSKALYAGRDLSVHRVASGGWSSWFRKWTFTRWSALNCRDCSGRRFGLAPGLRGKLYGDPLHGPLLPFAGIGIGPQRRSVRLVHLLRSAHLDRAGGLGVAYVRRQPASASSCHD